MRLTRVRNATGLIHLRKHLVAPEGSSSEEYRSGLVQLMEKLPKETFVMLLWEMGERDSEPVVHGFIIAFAPPGVDYVSLIQNSPTNSHPSLIDAFDLWVEAQHRTKVRFEYFKGREIPTFLKFHEYSRILEHVVPREVEGTDELPAAAPSLAKEPSNVGDSSTAAA